MEDIRIMLETFIEENPEWIECLVRFPSTTKNLTQKQMTDYKNLDITNYNSNIAYQIIKKLLNSRGIRGLHPAWFFILKQHFENDNFIFKEDDNNNLDFYVPENFKMPHRIQIISTLKIYYTVLTHTKIYECFIKKRSKFTKKYSEFKELNKYFFFPEIEKKITNKSIDLSYEFGSIMNSIEIEINEPEHNETTDIGRDQVIYFITNNRVIQCYMPKDIRKKDKDTESKINNCINEVLPKIIDDIFFKMTMSIYNKNKFAGLTFNAFIKNIINNLTLAIFFSELKKESNKQELSWKKFIEYCEAVQIYISKNYIKIINSKLPDDEEQRKKELNEHFYNYRELNDDTLLTETGYDHYLMQLTKEQSQDTLSITRMYSKYKQEYDKLMDTMLTEKDKELDYLRKYTETPDYLVMMLKQKLNITI